MSEKVYHEFAERLTRIEELLVEIASWLRIGNLREIRRILAEELDSPEKIRIYELTDGTLSQNEIASRVKSSRSKVSYYWQKWLGLGILVAGEQRKGRMKKIIPLEEVGISAKYEGPAQELEITFRPQDLREILKNSKMFHDVQELSEFARSILALPLGHDLSSYASMDELTDSIIEAFKQSDHIKQALFMQALERRADEKKDSQFQKYFEAWEKQIGR